MARGRAAELFCSFVWIPPFVIYELHYPFGFDTNVCYPISSISVTSGGIWAAVYHGVVTLRSIYGSAQPLCAGSLIKWNVRLT